MPNAANERVVERYFYEVIDRQDLSVLPELFDEKCLIYRADLEKPLVGFEALHGFLSLSHQAIAGAQTEFLRVFSDEDSVTAHLRHVVRFREWVLTPVGMCHAQGRTVTWVAIAMFGLRDGRIVEERVVRDELSILKQLGMLPQEWFPHEKPV